LTLKVNAGAQSRVDMAAFNVEAPSGIGGIRNAGCVDQVRK
jgi:hypothetical protein